MLCAWRHHWYVRDTVPDDVAEHIAQREPLEIAQREPQQLAIAIAERAPER